MRLINHNRTGFNGMIGINMNVVYAIVHLYEAGCHGLS